jgi:hypothetical protein
LIVIIIEFDGRPSSPPFLLVSSAQICIANSPEVPLTASPPVNGMLKPIVTGVPAGASARAAPSIPTKIAMADANHCVTFLNMFPPPITTRSSFPRKRESSAAGLTLSLDPRFRGDDE